MRRRIMSPFVLLLAAGIVLPFAGQLAVAGAATAPAKKVTTTISTKTPAQTMTVTAKATVKNAAGKGIKGAKVVFTWKFDTGNKPVTATTNSTGVASSKKNIGNATVGYKVVVSVKATAGGKSVTGSTYFTPHAIQSRNIDVRSGNFSPLSITLKAGEPAKLNFTKGTGCMKGVKSWSGDKHAGFVGYRSLGFANSSSLSVYTDLEAGPRTISITPKTAGNYVVQCWMDMRHLKVVIK